MIHRRSIIPPRRAWLLALVMPLALAFIACDREKGPVTPQLVITPTEFDFGIQDSYTNIPIVFKARNTSNKRIKILSTSTGCGCTTLGQKVEAIEPGQEATFTFDFQPGSREGQYHRNVQIRSDEGGQFDYELSFKGLLYSPLRWQPSVVSFGAIPGHQDNTRQISLINTAGDELGEMRASEIADERVRITYVETRPLTEVDPAGKTRTGEEYLFDVTIPAGQPAGRFTTEIVMDSSVAGAYFPALNVNGEIQCDVVTEPKRIFGKLAPGEKRSETLVLTSQSGTAFEVTQIDPPTGVPATYSVEDGATPGEKKLIATFDGGSAPGGSSGKLRLTIKSAGDDNPMILEIPVSCIIHSSN